MWSTAAMVAIDGRIDQITIKAAKELMDFCPSEAVLKSPRLLIDSDMKAAVLSNPSSNKIAGGVTTCTDLLSSLTEASLLTAARKEVLRAACRHGRMSVGSEYALNKLLLCRDMSAQAAKELATATMAKAASKKTPLPPVLMAALQAIEAGAAPAVASTGATIA
jgi:hypothetical protein